MDLLLLRSLGTRVCTMHWAVGVACVIAFAGYEAFALYLSWNKPAAIDQSVIEQRLNALEAKQDVILKLLQPQQPPQLSQQEEAVLGEAYQLMATISEVHRLEVKILATPAF